MPHEIENVPTNMKVAVAFGCRGQIQSITAGHEYGTEAPRQLSEDLMTAEWGFDDIGVRIC